MKKNILFFVAFLLATALFNSCSQQPTERTARKEVVEEKASLQTSLLQHAQKADSLYSNGTIDTLLMQKYVIESLVFAKKYPEEEITPELLFKAGVYSLTMAKFVKEDHLMVIKAKQGIEIFDQLEKVYPDFSKVKYCYLHRGDIYDNVLHDYKSAEMEYRTFIVKYSNDSLASNIQMYVDNILGKDQNEIVLSFEKR